MNRPTFRRGSATRLVFSLLAVLTIASCAAFSSEEGVENSWRDLPEATFRPGITTQAEVAELLGPPSQIISLASGTAFYYLREERRGRGFILIVYNQGTQTIRYDRAVFFFDRNGILTNHAMRNDIAPDAP
jgi:outer membrane protein assembly factor BamE (lipoprotein component of BamABCDE complex)